MISIRKGTIQDIPSISLLCEETIASICKKHYNTEQIRVWCDCFKNHKGLEDLFDDEEFFIAEINHQIVGIASLRFDGHLNLFYVHKEFQNQGVGKELINAVINFAEEDQILHIDAEVSKTAKSFFLKNNFAIKERNHKNLQGVQFTNYRMGKFVKVS